MTDGANRYCDACWALILDRGYNVATDLCDDCYVQSDHAGLVFVDEYELDERLLHELV